MEDRRAPHRPGLARGQFGPTRGHGTRHRRHPRSACLGRRSTDHRRGETRRRHRRSGRPPAASDPASSSRRRSLEPTAASRIVSPRAPSSMDPDVASDAPRRRGIGGFGSRGSSQPRSRARTRPLLVGSKRSPRSMPRAWVWLTSDRTPASWLCTETRCPMSKSPCDSRAGARSGAEGLAAPRACPNCLRSADASSLGPVRAGGHDHRPARWWPLC